MWDFYYHVIKSVFVEAWDFVTKIDKSMDSLETHNL